jgi:hypothetical protein
MRYCCNGGIVTCEQGVDGRLFRVGRAANQSSIGKNIAIRSIAVIEHPAAHIGKFNVILSVYEITKGEKEQQVERFHGGKNN